MQYSHVSKQRTRHGSGTKSYLMHRLFRPERPQALQLAEATGDSGALAFAWVSQALLTAMQGDRHANAEAYVTALEHATGSGDLLTQTRVHNNLASSHLEEARYEQAVEHLQTGLLLNEATGHLSVQALLTPALGGGDFPAPSFLVFFADHVLVVGAEKLSDVVDPTDRSISFLLGDANCLSTRGQRRVFVGVLGKQLKELLRMLSD